MVLPYLKGLINKESFLSISILLFLGYFYYNNISGLDLQQIPWPVLHRKGSKLPDFAELNRFEDRKRPETEIKEYQIKSTGNKHVK